MSKADPFAALGFQPAQGATDPFASLGFKPAEATPAPAAAPPSQPAPDAHNPIVQMGVGALPLDLADRFKGVARAIGRVGMGAIQYGQYLTGNKVSPTPLFLEPSVNPEQQVGEKIGNIAIPAAVAAATGGASLPVQAGVGAITGGLVDQGTGGTGTAGAVVGGAAPAVVKGATEAASALVKQAAPLVNRWLQVPSKELDYGADPGMRLVQEKLVKATKAATEKAIQPALDEAGTQLGAKLADATSKGVQIDATTPIIDSLTNATKRIGIGRDPAFQARLDQILSDILKDYPDPSKLTPVEAQALKRSVGDSIKWHGMPFEGDINQALVKIYGGINDALRTAIPDVQPLQSRWGDLYVAAKSIEDALRNDRAGVGTGALNPIVKRAGVAIGVGVPTAEGVRRLMH